jgi:hypothetical protein
MEEQEDYEEQEECDDHESEEEQHSRVLFMSEQVEVLLKMNRCDSTGLVEALKGVSFKSVGFKPAKLENFHEFQDRKCGCLAYKNGRLPRAATCLFNLLIPT